MGEKADLSKRVHGYIFHGIFSPETLESTVQPPQIRFCIKLFHHFIFIPNGGFSFRIICAQPLKCAFTGPSLILQSLAFLDNPASVRFNRSISPPTAANASNCIFAALSKKYALYVAS
eukprot:770722_1